MKIQNALLKDINELYKLEHSIFERENFPLSKSSFRYHIKNNLLLVAKEKEKIIGYILILVKRKNAKIYSICVDKEHRGKKISFLLLDDSIKYLKKLGFTKTVLEVRVDNTIAIKLYKDFGFKIIKTLNSFYLDGCDAYFMELDHGYKKLHKTI